jgi:hypothetical protein
MSDDYKKRGYQLFRSVLPAGDIAALSDLAYDSITSYPGEMRRQDGSVSVNCFHHGSTLVKNSVLNAHFSLPEELTELRLALRKLITSSAIFDVLHALDGAEHYTVHQTIVFLAAQTTVPHLDSWTVDTAPHGFAHTLWIPLDDMDYLSGLPAVSPWPVGKFVTEAELGLPDGEFTFRQRHDRHCEALAKRLRTTGADIHTFFARRGDVLVWSSLTPHFTLPSSPAPRKRVSIQLVVRPTHHRWGNYVIQPAEWTPDRAEKVSDRFSFIVV